MIHCRLPYQGKDSDKYDWVIFFPKTVLFVVLVYLIGRC